MIILVSDIDHAFDSFVAIALLRRGSRGVTPIVAVNAPMLALWICVFTDRCPVDAPLPTWVRWSYPARNSGGSFLGCISCIEEAVMTELFVLEPAAADEPTDRIPEGLPVGGAERGPLERALRNAGLAIASVPFDVLVDAPEGDDDRRELRAAVTAVVHAAADTELDRLSAAVHTDPDDGLDEALWGPAPDSVAVSKAAFADLQDQFAARRQLSIESLSRDDAAQLLGVAPQSITAKLAAGKLVGLKMGREWRLPMWQFDSDDPSGILRDLDRLQSVFPGGVVSLSAWMQREQPEFGGRSPREVMSRRGSAPVIALAQALTAAAW